MGSKKEIREEIKRIKKSLTSRELKEKSIRIVNNIEALDSFRSAKTVLMFYPLPDEPDLTPLIQGYLETKRIILPGVDGDNIILRQFSGSSQMHIGAFGIKEPDNKVLVDTNSIDLVIVPGVAFDKKGNRIGRGKGYYDKLLSDKHFKAIMKIGCAFGFQIIDSVPMECHDIKIDGVVCEDYACIIKGR